MPGNMCSMDLKMSFLPAAIFIGNTVVLLLLNTQTNYGSRYSNQFVTSV